MYNPSKKYITLPDALTKADREALKFDCITGAVFNAQSLLVRYGVNEGDAARLWQEFHPRHGARSLMRLAPRGAPD